MGEMVVGRASGANTAAYSPFGGGSSGGGPYPCWGSADKKQPPKEYKALLFYVEQILARKLTQEESTIILALVGGENHVPEK